jgi:PAS domain S-box-containing protein
MAAPYSSGGRWRALAGEWARFVGGTLPSDFSPCGTVLEHDCAQLLAHPERYYPIPESLTPLAAEVLLIPFHVAGKGVGTIWVVAHDEIRKFDREDLRLMTNLGRFAATAYQLRTALESERRLRERLEAKSAELERLAATSTVGLTRLDRELRYRMVNRAYAEWAGMAAHDIVGRTMVEVLGEQAFTTIRPHVERVLAGQVVEYEAQIQLHGEPRFIHVNYTPDINEHGAVIGWVASVMDVTQRKRVETAAADEARQKNSLYELADRLHRATSLGEILEAALDALQRALSCNRAAIVLCDEAEVMRFVAWRGLSEAYRQATQGHSPWEAGDKYPQPICVSDVARAALPQSLQIDTLAEGIRALVFIPIVVNGKLIGQVVACHDTVQGCTRDELELALTIAHQLAFAVDRHRAQNLLGAHARQLALITETAPVLIVHCDVHTRYKFVNKAYAERFGVTPQSCVGKTVAQVIGAEAYESIRPYVQRALAGERVEFEICIPYAALGESFMHCWYAPQLDDHGNVVGFVGAIVNISERRRAEEALRSSEERLKEADRRKDEFLAMLAHELRNPLAPINTAAHVLKLSGADPRRVAEAGEVISRQVGHLTRLVDDLLDVSRVTRGLVQLEREPVDLRAIVTTAIEQVRPLLQSRGHELRTGLGHAACTIDGDYHRLVQIVSNLLNNAAKYTPQGGRIDVGLEAVGGRAVLTVTDNGVGIAPGMLEQVFELFTQAERTPDRSQGGLGIGLALVRTLVRLHGGEVRASSAGLQQGSTFRVELPVAAAVSTVLPVQASAPGGGAGRRVFIVDDNVDAAHTLRDVLEIMGHTVALAHDGESALKRASDAPSWDAFILDIGLPDMTGYELARRLREHESGRQSTFVALTGYGQAHDRVISRTAGFDHHLVKPADLSLLTGILSGPDGMD